MDKSATKFTMDKKFWQDYQLRLTLWPNTLYHKQAAPKICYALTLKTASLPHNEELTLLLVDKIFEFQDVFTCIDFNMVMGFLIHKNTKEILDKLDKFDEVWKSIYPKFLESIETTGPVNLSMTAGIF